MDVNHLGANAYIESQSTSKLVHNLKKPKVEDKELMDACKEFEAYFIKQLLSEMKKTINESDEESLFSKSQSEKIFEDMLDDEYAKNASQGQGIGIAKMLYKQMSRNR